MHILHKVKYCSIKDHYPLPFIDQMLDRLAGHSHCCFLDGYLGYNKIVIAPKDQERPHSHSHMTLLLLEGCHLGCVMLLQLFKDL